MNYFELKKLDRLYFSHLYFADKFNIKEQSAKVAINRYIKKGFILKLKRGLYILMEKFLNLTNEEKFVIANILEVPSYISLTTALSFYGLTTQVQQNYFESISVYRTKEVVINSVTFRYSKINKKSYFGFIKNNNFFIATPEKALVDALYLKVRGKYNIDLSAVDIKKFDKKEIKKIISVYPKKIKKAILSLCKI